MLAERGARSPDHLSVNRDLLSLTLGSARLSRRALGEPKAHDPDGSWPGGSEARGCPVQPRLAKCRENCVPRKYYRNTCRRRALRLRVDDKRPHALSASAALQSSSARLTSSLRNSGVDEPTAAATTNGGRSKPFGPFADHLVGRPVLASASGGNAADTRDRNDRCSGSFLGPMPCQRSLRNRSPTRLGVVSLSAKLHAAGTGVCHSSDRMGFP